MKLFSFFILKECIVFYGHSKSNILRIDFRLYYTFPSLKGNLTFYTKFKINHQLKYFRHKEIILLYFNKGKQCSANLKNMMYMVLIIL